MRCFLIAFAMVLFCCACTDDVGRSQGESLCERAYEWRYACLDSTEWLARQALAFPGVSAEASCLLAFTAALRMNYPEAEQLYRQVIADTRSELLRLTAQVGMMRVCQRRGANKEFYDHYTGALAAIERLTGDVSLMDDHQLRLWRAALTDLHLQLSVYYYYLRQEAQAGEEFDWLGSRRQLFEGDTAQWALFHYLKGNVRHADGHLRDDNLRDLHIAQRVAREHGYAYIEAKARASILQDEVWVEGRPIEGEGDSILRAFSQYGSLFDVSQTYLLIGRSWLDIDADSALHYMQLALDRVSEHHRRFNPLDSAFCGLLPSDSLLGEGSVEMRWIRDSLVVCLPEWMADVREGLCMAYSALGMKAEADCNRNIYLDILDATRQDRSMEQRRDALERQERLVGRGMLSVAVVTLALLGLLACLVRHVLLRHAQRYAREQAALEAEMTTLVERSNASQASLEEYEETLDEARRAHEARLDTYKRRWVDKLTCLSIVHAITPFLDRILYEVRKPAPCLNYIAELAGRINLYNDILTRWIKVRQGAVALHIETFSLQSLFEILAKSRTLFDKQGICLNVEPTSLKVKADRALTLFMMNTLLDNARKFTLPGGRVSLQAVDGGEWVEIGVEDTGVGLGEEDVQRINGERGYDPAHLTSTALPQGKGQGFGLLNCRGIIEKYRKTSPRFRVCMLGVSSRVGEGSRFFFRLPKGAVVAVLLALLGGGQATSQDRRTITDAPADGVYIPYEPTDSLLRMADEYAYRAYDANVCGEYEQALVAVDSACQWLNRFYRRSHPDGGQLMQLFPIDSMPEITLWSEGFDTDYHIILDIRNEAAIAALALQQWDVYYYNNEIYVRLYKLMAQDCALADYCSALAEAMANKRALFRFLSAVALLLILIYCIVYYRTNILTVFNMRQILELGRMILASPAEEGLADLLRQGINPIRHTDGICLAFPNGRFQFSRGCPAQEYLRPLLQSVLEERSDAPTLHSGGRIRLLPLIAESGDDRRRIGILAIVLHSPSSHKDDERLLPLIARHTAANIYYSSVRNERLRLGIELKEDERRRVQTEAESAHVQNMVLDNCLSAIKHETMFYPSRISQLAVQLQQQDSIAPEALNSLKELATYYKEVFTLLASCARKQLERPLLRRSHIPCSEMAAYARQAAERVARKSNAVVEWDQQPCEGVLLADRSMLAYLIDNLMEVAVGAPSGPNHSQNAPLKRKIELLFEQKENFITFALNLDVAPMSAEQLHSLFYPEAMTYAPEEGSLRGMPFLIAKQIVRQHDDLVRRGCRISVMNLPKGLRIEVTLPGIKSASA